MVVMVQVEVKVSNKFQIVIPKEIRERLGIREGDRLLVSIDGDHIRIVRAPKSMTDFLLGLHKEVWKGVEVKDYIDGERGAWE